MPRKILVLAVAALLAAALLVFTPVGTAVAKEVLEVIVKNWPDVFNVEGKVRVEGPTRNASMVRFEGITLPPVRRDETTRVLEAGTLDSDGFRYVVINLTGQIQGQLVKPGDVGVVLLPDERTVEEAFDQKGRYLLPLEVRTGDLRMTAPYFAAPQARFELGFTRYRVLLYNSSNKTVRADVFAYLTN